MFVVLMLLAVSVFAACEDFCEGSIAYYDGVVVSRTGQCEYKDTFCEYECDDNVCAIPLPCDDYCEDSTQFSDGNYNIILKKCEYDHQKGCDYGCNENICADEPVEEQQEETLVENLPSETNYVESDYTDVEIDTTQIMTEQNEVIIPEVGNIFEDVEQEDDLEEEPEEIIESVVEPEIQKELVDAQLELVESQTVPNIISQDCNAYCEQIKCVREEVRLEGRKVKVVEINEVVEKFEADSVEIVMEENRPVYNVRKKIKKTFLWFIPYTVEETVKVDALTLEEIGEDSDWSFGIEKECLTSAVMFNLGKEGISIDIGDVIITTDENGKVTTLLDSGNYNYKFKMGEGEGFKEVKIGKNTEFDLEPQYNYLFKGFLNLKDTAPTCVKQVNLDFTDLSPYGGSCDNCNLGCSNLGMTGLKKCGGEQLKSFYAKECSSVDDCKIDCSQLDGPCVEDIDLTCFSSYGAGSKSFCVHSDIPNEERDYIKTKGQALADEFCKALPHLWGKEWPEARAVNVEVNGRFLDWECTLIVNAKLVCTSCSGSNCETVVPGFAYPRFNIDLYLQKYAYLNAPDFVYFPWDDPEVDEALVDYDLTTEMFVDVLEEFNNKENFWYYWE